MQLSGRPLLATRVDVPLYVDSGIEATVLNAARRGLNALVVGDAGAGKTSLLHRVEFELRQEGMETAFVDGRSCNGLDALLDKIRVQLRVEAPRSQNLFAAVTGQQFVETPASAERTLAKIVAAIPPEPRWVVFLDSPERDVAHTLFGRFRDTVWQLPITWIVAADSNGADAFRRPPADAFFELVERIPAIDQARANEILHRRGVAEMLSVDAGMGGSTPRTLLDHARRLVLDDGTVAELQQSETEFQRRLGDVSRAAAMLATELRGQGAVSASDADVQRRLGWTRPRLTQVLKELEAAGLARATEASDGHAGRPRRLYEIVAA